MPDIYSIAEITKYLRQLLENDPTLQDTWVQGEISNMRPAASGHWYFTLKDANAQLKCVMWKSNAQRQSTIPRDGDQIIVHGRVGIFEPRGDYQFYADFIRPVGIGDLYARFEQLKEKLNAEGLFDPAHKKPLPFFPLQIGVVTSADAAAFQDILNVLRRRFPIAKVLISPTLVQGNDAPPMIADAIRRLDETQTVDVIIVARGGGSIEDLWAFNDEVVARAVFDAKTPIIAGIGHETDFTIIDFVADYRAPTPSVAAEIATPNITDLSESIQAQRNALHTTMTAYLQQTRDTLAYQKRQLTLLSPRTTIQNQRQRVDDMNTRLLNLQRANLNLLHERLSAKNTALNAANPINILKRGYAIVTRSADHHIIKQPSDAPDGTQITITVHGGNLSARIEES